MSSNPPLHETPTHTMPAVCVGSWNSSQAGQSKQAVAWHSACGPPNLAHAYSEGSTRVLAAAPRMSPHTHICLHPALPVLSHSPSYTPLNTPVLDPTSAAIHTAPLERGALASSKGDDQSTNSGSMGTRRVSAVSAVCEGCPSTPQRATIQGRVGHTLVATPGKATPSAYALQRHLPVTRAQLGRPVLSLMSPTQGSSTKAVGLPAQQPACAPLRPPPCLCMTPR